MVVSFLYARALQGSKVWVKLPGAHCRITAMSSKPLLADRTALRHEYYQVCPVWLVLYQGIYFGL